MALFGSKPKARRPVEQIVAGLAGMITELKESNSMAADEQKAAEDQIIALQAERKILINEQTQAGTIVGNLESLLGLDLDGDGEADDLDRAIAALSTPAPVADASTDTGDEG